MPAADLLGRLLRLRDDSRAALSRWRAHKPHWFVAVGVAGYAFGASCHLWSPDYAWVCTKVSRCIEALFPF